MRIKYLGGRSHFEISYNRKSYHFTPENNRTLDIQEKEIINYIFGLPNRAEFEVVVEEPKQPIIPKPKADDKKIIEIEKTKKSKGGKSNAKKKR